MLKEDDTSVLSLSRIKNEGYKYCDPGPKTNRNRNSLNPSPPRYNFITIKMIVKIAAIFVLLGVCYALPVDEPKVVEHVPSVETTPLEPTLVKPEELPQPPKPDSSDLKPDASSWWHSWYHYNYPVYHYDVHSVPTYTYWHKHW